MLIELRQIEEAKCYLEVQMSMCIKIQKTRISVGIITNMRVNKQKG